MMQERWRALNESDGGDMENMTYEEIAEKHPDEFEERAQNKFTYRYPSGESYQVRTYVFVFIDVKLKIFGLGWCAAGILMLFYVQKLFSVSILSLIFWSLSG